MKILVINGPNLQMLGRRNPQVYGTRTLADINRDVCSLASELHAECTFFQSNHEGDLCDRIAQAVSDGTDGIIINPAAYTHTSIALHDALEGAAIPAVEVHLSNIASRDEFRHRSLTAPCCIGQITGFGGYGYELALRALVHFIEKTERPAGKTADCKSETKI